MTRQRRAAARGAAARGAAARLTLSGACLFEPGARVRPTQESCGDAWSDIP